MRYRDPCPDLARRLGVLVPPPARRGNVTGLPALSGLSGIFGAGISTPANGITDKNSILIVDKNGLFITHA